MRRELAAVTVAALGARAAHAVVSTDQAIYALAGTGAGGAPVLQVGAIYLFGGESEAQSASLAEVLWLGAGSRQWRAAPAMPTPRNFARAVVFRGTVYVVGGSPTPGQSHASEGSRVVESFRCGETHG